MRAIGYRAAIQWLVDNDDTEWAKDDEPAISVTAALISDIYGVTDERVTCDLRRALTKAGRT
jgi:hypothetical protein